LRLYALAQKLRA